MDGLKKISIKASASNTSKNIIIIQEAKKGTLVPFHIRDTVFLKDYANCYLNGNNKKARQLSIPLIDTVKKLKLKLSKTKAPDEIVYQFLTDNICVQAEQEIQDINSYKKYIIHQSSGTQVPIRVEYISYFSHIKQLHLKYGINWLVASDLTNTLEQFSTYGNEGGLFYNPRTKKYCKIDSQYILPL